jgi:PIN domain nuclease of toxin-antitoxin system
MNLLLDTHVWIWFSLADRRLGEKARAAIQTAAGTVALSPVSLWETALLVGKGRLEVDRPVRLWVEEALRRFPMVQIPLDKEIALLAAELEIHPDPADRFLAATALVDARRLMTADQRLLAAVAIPTVPARE